MSTRKRPNGYASPAHIHAVAAAAQFLFIVSSLQPRRMHRRKPNRVTSQKIKAPIRSVGLCSAVLRIWLNREHPLRARAPLGNAGQNHRIDAALRILATARISRCLDLLESTKRIRQIGQLLIACVGAYLRTAWGRCSTFVLLSGSVRPSLANQPNKRAFPMKIVYGFSRQVIR